MKVKKKLSVTLSDDVVSEIEDIATKSGVNRSLAIELLLRKALKKNKNDDRKVELEIDG